LRYGDQNSFSTDSMVYAAFMSNTLAQSVFSANCPGQPHLARPQIQNGNY